MTPIGTKTIVLELSYAAIISCLEASPDSTTIEQAVVNVLEGAMQDRRLNGELGSYSIDELEFLMANFEIQHATYDADMKDMADQVERQIESSAAANISKEVEISSEAIEVISAPSFDVFTQPRKELAELLREAPLDSVLTAASNIPRPMPHDDAIMIAAIEIVYTNFPRDMWDSEKSRAQIMILFDLHKKVMFADVNTPEHEKGDANVERI